METVGVASECSRRPCHSSLPVRKGITGQDQASQPPFQFTFFAPWSAHSQRSSQVASEKAELSAVLVGYEKDINLLESLYNDNKALLDQHNPEGARRVRGCCTPLADGSKNTQDYKRGRRMAQLDQSRLW